MQKQGDSIGKIFCNSRQQCRTVDCSASGDDMLVPYAARDGLKLPTVHGYVAFRGDDPRLPAHIRAVTSLHSKFIPVQTGHGGVMSKLAKQFVELYSSMGVKNVSVESLLPWLQSIRKQSGSLV